MDARAWDQRYRESESLWSVTPNLFVEDRLRGREPGLGLDLAAGEGRNSIWLAERGWRMTAVDFSEIALARGRERTDLVSFELADVREWEPEDSFDLILVAYLHLPEDQMRRVITNAAGWLAPGGELFVIGHDPSNIDLGHGGPQEPRLLWGVEELRAWTSELRDVENVVVRRPVETDEGTVFARDALRRGLRPA